MDKAGLEPFKEVIGLGHDYSPWPSPLETYN